MGDLIDRNELAEEIKSLRVTLTGFQNGKIPPNIYEKEYRETVLRIIDEQPTMEAEHVRCGECRHSVPAAPLTLKKTPGCRTCRNWHAPCNNRNVLPEWYCPFGEKREDGDGDHH